MKLTKEYIKNLILEELRYESVKKPKIKYPIKDELRLIDKETSYSFLFVLKHPINENIFTTMVFAKGKDLPSLINRYKNKQVVPYKSKEKKSGSRFKLIPKEKEESFLMEWYAYPGTDEGVKAMQAQQRAIAAEERTRQAEKRAKEPQFDDDEEDY